MVTQPLPSARRMTMSAGTTSDPGVRSSKGSAPTAIGPAPGPPSLGRGRAVDRDRPQGVGDGVGRPLEAPRPGLDRQPGGDSGGDEPGPGPHPGEPVGAEDVEQIVDLARGRAPGCG